MPDYRLQIVFVVLLACGWCVNVPADGPKDNQAESVRPIPPAGKEIPSDVADSLVKRCESIRQDWSGLVAKRQVDPAAKMQPWQREAKVREQTRVESLASEVLVFPRAVEMALEFNQFYKPAEFKLANELLDEAQRRLDAVEAGGDWANVVGWTDADDLNVQTDSSRTIIGGFQSKIDGSHQPYGLVLPRHMEPDDTNLRRLDIWFHGRGETMSEVAFFGRQSSAGGKFNPGNSFTPQNSVVLHPYGRYCNAFKFAGEIDVLEALEYVRSRMPVDADRISVRGFSMGGAGCWQFATRYADRWFAANPGAGFSETPEFLRTFQGEDVSNAPAYEQAMWQMYDCPEWSINLAQCPTVAYSGEIDRQKQAADVMEAAMEKVGIDLTHIIGPQTAHKIHPDSKVEIERRMGELTRNATATTPQVLHFATHTLRYHRMHWLDVRGLKEHWKQARVDARIEGDAAIEVSTINVARLRLSFDAGQWPGQARGHIRVRIDGQDIRGGHVGSDRSWQIELEQVNDQWAIAGDESQLRKRPGLQGPIDDAFMDSFVFVLPSGTCDDEAVQQWIEQESEHAMTEWRKHFRGDIVKVMDRDLTDTMIENHHLILFGTPKSNSIIAKVMSDLPATWNESQISVGDSSVPAAGHAAILIAPNPIQTSKYVVLNSGFTYREYDYLNNARQTPKLPDWALVDVSDGATTRAPGKVVHAGFYNEQWK